MSNLYEILEVSEKASKEVIDKAYHVLAKKYHPDLQQEDKKKIAEEKMKKVNEAYEILGDIEKRKKYDEELELKREEQKRIEEMQRRQEQENIQNTVYSEFDDLERLKQEEILRQRNVQAQENNNMKILQNEMKRAYAQAYNDYLRSSRI